MDAVVFGDAAAAWVSNGSKDRSKSRLKSVFVFIVSLEAKLDRV